MVWRDVTISVGGINIAVESHCVHEFELPVDYEKFITDESPDTVLRVWDCKAPFPLEKVVFDSEKLSTYGSSEELITQVHIQDVTGTSRDVVMRRIPSQKSMDLYTTYLHPLKRLLFRYVLSTILSGDGAVIHAAGVSDKGKGLIFAGVSGAGKSTIASLWKSRDCTVLSEDTVIIRKRGDNYQIYGTPWAKNIQLSSPETCILDGIFFIRHALQNTVTPVEGTLTSLLRHTFCPRWDRAAMQGTMEFLSGLAREVPCYNLGFVPDESVVDLVRTV
jgi:hypothetical protein